VTERLTLRSTAMVFGICLKAATVTVFFKSDCWATYVGAVFLEGAGEETRGVFRGATGAGGPEAWVGQQYGADVRAEPKHRSRRAERATGGAERGWRGGAVLVG